MLKDAKLYREEQEIRLINPDEYIKKDGEMGGKIFKDKKRILNYLGTSLNYEKCELRYLTMNE